MAVGRHRDFGRMCNLLLAFRFVFVILSLATFGAGFPRRFHCEWTFSIYPVPDARFERARDLLTFYRANGNHLAYRVSQDCEEAI